MEFPQVFMVNIFKCLGAKVYSWHMNRAICVTYIQNVNSNSYVTIATVYIKDGFLLKICIH